MGRTMRRTQQDGQGENTMPPLQDMLRITCGRHKNRIKRQQILKISQETGSARGTRSGHIVIVAVTTHRRSSYSPHGLIPLSYLLVTTAFDKVYQIKATTQINHYIKILSSPAQLFYFKTILPPIYPPIYPLINSFNIFEKLNIIK